MYVQQDVIYTVVGSGGRMSLRGPPPSTMRDSSQLHTIAGILHAVESVQQEPYAAWANSFEVLGSN